MERVKTSPGIFRKLNIFCLICEKCKDRLVKSEILALNYSQILLQKDAETTQYSCFTAIIVFSEK